MSIKEIIHLIFLEYEFKEVSVNSNLNVSFYIKKDKKIASYFLVNYLDCSDVENNSTSIKKELDLLENCYIKNELEQDKSLKMKLLDTFENDHEASQLDKNLSAIYIMKMKDLKNLHKHQNVIYALEESPYYFKRFLIPYTENQVELLNLNTIDSFSKQLNLLANDNESYEKILNNRYTDDLYSLIVRLFSKIPFLHYSITSKDELVTIEKTIDIILKENKEGEIKKNLSRETRRILKNEDRKVLVEYHDNVIENINISEENFFETYNYYEISIEKIEEKIRKLLEE